MNEVGSVKRSWRLRFMVLAALVILGLAAVPWLGQRTVAQPAAKALDHNGDRYLFSDLAERVIPSVVTVYVKRDLRKEMDPKKLEQLKKWHDQLQDPLLKQLIPFDIPGTEGGEEGDPFITKGSGSGVIVSPDGYVVTNWHVVGDKKNTPELRVVMSDNTELSGKDVEVIESSQLSDLALIKINRKGLQSITWGDSDKLRIGEWVAAIGSPLDLRLTVSQGIVCAMHRTIESAAGMGGMIQTDAVINPGSSGGALVNMDGHLIGLNRLITTPFQGREAWSGFGFAIPANDVRRFVDMVIKHGGVAYGYIGVGVANEFQDSAKLRNALGLAAEQKGALVFNVTAGGPASEAGLQEGDLIIQADKQAVTNYNDLVSYVANCEIGKTIKLSVLRPQENGKPKRMSVDVKIAKRPTDEELTKSMSNQEPAPAPKPKESETNELGVKVEPYSEGGRSGLKILEVQPGSAAQRAGLVEGDVLLEINHTSLKAPGDIVKAMEAQKSRPHLIRFLHEGRAGLIAIDQPPQRTGKKKQ